jgi:hypothetical protein
MALTSSITAAVIPVLPMGGFYHTKFHQWFSHLSNFKAVASTISEAAVLVLLLQGIFGVCH